MNFNHKKSGSLAILIAVVVLIILMVFIIVGAAAFTGSRTGVQVATTSTGNTNNNNTNAPIVNGACLNVPAIKQNGAEWCGRSAGQMEAVFYNSSIGTDPNWQNNHFIGGFSVNMLNNYSGKSFRVDRNASNVSKAIQSISNGNPVVYYSTFGSGGEHFFVLTGYDSSTQTFLANDPYTGKGCTSKILGHTLTLSTLSESSNCKYIVFLN